MSRRLLVWRWLALGLWLSLGLASTASAHKASDAYLTVQVDSQAAPEAALSGQWDIALRDLEQPLNLDRDNNAQITWGELRSQRDTLARYAFQRLALTLDGHACTLRDTGLLVDEHTDGGYAVLQFAARCPGATRAPRSLQAHYSLFAELDPQHRGLLRLAVDGVSRSAVFSPATATQTFELAAPSRWAQFSTYLVEGAWHIWIGFDHILFLVSLLLPAVLVWRRRRWQPVARLRDAVVDVLKIVSAFTLAHSITLSLAALGLIALPSRLVESAIAASVVLAALNNLYPVVEGRRWVVAFVFGLIHGFGFASVLADLGLPQGALALALVGFNLGVELGQLAIVAAFLPLAYLLRATRFYRWGVLGAGSAVIVLLAALWFTERAFDIQLLGF